MPLFTTTPNRIRNPIITFALFSRLLPVSNNANSEPIAANGIENSSTNGVVRDSKTEANIIKIRINAANSRNLKSANISSSWNTSTATPEGRL